MVVKVALYGICSNKNLLDKMGVQVSNFVDGLVSYARTQVASDCGMNHVEYTPVGCAASLGSLPVNAVLYGGTPLLLGKPSLRRVVNPNHLITAVVALIVTFL